MVAQRIARGRFSSHVLACAVVFSVVALALGRDAAAENATKVLPNGVVRFRRWRERRWGYVRAGLAGAGSNGRQTKVTRDKDAGNKLHKQKQSPGRLREQGQELIEDVDPLDPEPKSASASTLKALLNALSAAAIFFVVAPGTFPAAAILVSVFYKLWNYVRGQSPSRSASGEGELDDSVGYAGVPSSAYEAGKYSGPILNPDNRDSEAQEQHDPTY